MKIVLTGATGFVGSHVLDRLLADPEVTGVTCLTRRHLPREDPKLTSVVHDDFTRYGDDLMTRLADHSACIWTLGGKESDAADPVQYERVTHTFTLNFAHAMAAAATGPFTFCYLSGMGADPTESTRLPWERTTRHLKGRTEKDLVRLAREHDTFTVHCFRPGGILPATTGTAARVLLAPIAVSVATLSTALVRVACTEPAGQPTVLRNSLIRHLGRPSAG